MVGKIVTFGVNRQMEIIEYKEVSYSNPDIIGRFKAKGKRGAIVSGFHYKSGKYQIV